MAPVVHGLETEYYQDITFSYLDIDDPANETFKQQLGFRYQPQFFLLDENGKVLQQWAGSVSAQAFRDAFEMVIVQ